MDTSAEVITIYYVIYMGPIGQCIIVCNECFTNKLYNYINSIYNGKVN